MHCAESITVWDVNIAAQEHMVHDDMNMQYGPCILNNAFGLADTLEHGE